MLESGLAAPLLIVLDATDVYTGPGRQYTTGNVLSIAAAVELGGLKSVVVVALRFFGMGGLQCVYS